MRVARSSVSFPLEFFLLLFFTDLPLGSVGIAMGPVEGWDHTVELHPLSGCVGRDAALTTRPTPQVPQFPGLVHIGIKNDFFLKQGEKKAPLSAVLSSNLKLK